MYLAHENEFHPLWQMRLTAVLRSAAPFQGCGQLATGPTLINTFSLLLCL
jgi:hypothetical protein